MRVTNQITFTAKDDAEALRLAAERLGRDAVILSTQMIKEGGVLGFFQRSVLKVTAGILEDDSPKPQPKTRTPANNSPISTMDEDTRRENLIAFQKLMELKEKSSSGQLSSPPSQNISSTPANNLQDNTISLGEEGYRLPSDNVKISPEGLRNAYGLTTRPAPVTPPPQIQPVMPPVMNQPAQPAINNNDAQALKNQVGALADRIDLLLQRISAVETGVAAQAQAQKANFQAGMPQFTGEDSGIEGRLRSSEVDEKYIRKLLGDYGVMARKEKNKKLPFTKWLATQIECSGDNGGDAAGGRKVMLLGPTGVGKTTTIAKLAAIKALWEHKRVLLLTSDTYRIAAVEQLKTYAKILGVPIEIIFDIATIQNIVNQHENSDIILLDTAGRSQRDKKNMELFENLYNSFAPDAVHLVLSANMKYKDMLDVVEHIPNIPVSHLLFTKLDETVSYGSIFNIQQVMGCPVSFLTVGQNVPKDIETASGTRIADFLMKSEEERKRG
ncbi:MAG: flagellar biosynthesis protein FlhF [Synergistaceae bacterium]|nr:flagellar biosynthesis protein FlhF [Synergistaceae bacterium]